MTNTSDHHSPKWAAPALSKFARWAGAERARFILFVFAAGLSVPVNLLSRIGFSLVTPFEVAIVLSQFCGMIVAYVLAKFFVFEPSKRDVHHEFSRFLLVNLVSLVQTWLVSVGLVDLVFPLLKMKFYPELTGHFIGLATTAITSFILHKRFSFAPEQR
jgi:putative flippase GtrA